MRLIEEIIDVEHSASATARRVANPDDFYFQGRFPGQPVVPAVILVELLAQTGGLAAAAPDNSHSGHSGLPGKPLQLRIAALGPLKFPAAAVPARSSRRARASPADGTIGQGRGHGHRNSVLVATGSLTLAG